MRADRPGTSARVVGARPTRAPLRDWAHARTPRAWSMAASTLQFDGERHRVNLRELTGGRSVTIYAQAGIVKDLIQARLADGAALEFEVSETKVAEVDSVRPVLRHADARREESAWFEYLPSASLLNYSTRCNILASITATFPQVDGLSESELGRTGAAGTSRTGTG